MPSFQQKTTGHPKSPEKTKLEDIKQAWEVRLRYDTDVGINRQEILKSMITWRDLMETNIQNARTDNVNR